MDEIESVNKNIDNNERVLHYGVMVSYKALNFKENSASFKDAFWISITSFLRVFSFFKSSAVLLR